jgi:hypothetical protein
MKPGICAVVCGTAVQVSGNTSMDFFPMHVIPMSINWSRTGRLPWYVVGERVTDLCNLRAMIASSF